MSEVITPVAIVNAWAKAHPSEIEGVDVGDGFDIKSFFVEADMSVLGLMAFLGLRLEGEAIHYDVEKFPIIAAILDSLNEEFYAVTRGTRSYPAILARSLGYDGQMDYGEWVDYNSGYPSSAVSVLVAMSNGGER